MDLVLSIVERYLIQCPFLGVSVKRGSTVEGEGVVGSLLHHCSSAAPTLSARDGEHNISCLKLIHSQVQSCASSSITSLYPFLVVTTEVE